MRMMKVCKSDLKQYWNIFYDKSDEDSLVRYAISVFFLIKSFKSKWLEFLIFLKYLYPHN